MPIVVRRGRITAEPRSRLLRFERPTAVMSGVRAIGTTLPEPDLRHELARLALDLVVRTAEPMDLPARWSTFAFGSEVDRTRAQLGPIHSREALLGSFSREASIAVTRTADPLLSLPAGPVRVAYAIRWLELGDGRARPSWSAFIAGPVDLIADALVGQAAIGPNRTASPSALPAPPVRDDGEAAATAPADRLSGTSALADASSPSFFAADASA